MQLNLLTSRRQRLIRLKIPRRHRRKQFFIFETFWHKVARFSAYAKKRKGEACKPILKIIVLGIMMFGSLSIAAGSSGINHRDIFVGASARAVGMGSAFTAGPSATNGFLWNPSSLGFMDGAEVNLGGIPSSGGSSGTDKAFSFAANPYTLGLTEKNIGNLSVASWLDGWKNNTTDSTQIVLLGYGLALGQRASAGANLRYYQNNTPLRTNFLWSVDLGMQFAYPLKKLGDSVTVGLNLSELSSGIREDGVLIERAPLAARFGTTYRLDDNTLFSTDIAIHGQNETNWGDRMRLHLGAERWLFNGQFGFRLGYNALTAADKFRGGEWSRGLSFRNSAGQLDYAYVSGNELEQGLHWISATLRWGGTRPAYVSEPASPEARSDVPEAVDAAPILMPTTLEANGQMQSSALTNAVGGLQLSERAISPNNDSIADSTTFRFQVSPNDKWQLTLRDEYTEIVWEQSGTGSPPEGIVWEGMADTGELVIDGDYEAQLHVLDKQGTPQLRNSETVTVDLMPTTLEIFKKAPATIGVKTWDINPIAQWKLEIFDEANELVEEREGDGSPPEAVVLAKLQQPAAMYTCKLSVQDIAGNQSVQQAQLALGAATQTTATQGRLTLMVGSFTQPHNARMMAENLQHSISQYWPNEEVQIYTVTINAKTVHRVTIGEFTAREDATRLKQHIQETQGVEPVLIALK